MKNSIEALKSVTIQHLTAIGFERISYFSIQSVIVLYLVSESIDFTRSEALEVYGVFSIVAFITMFLGALLGDFVLGNKLASRLGLLVQFLGAISLCLENKFGAYIGLALIALGSGLFVPNIFSQFGKLYITRPKILDQGFTIYYIILSLGGLIGGLISGFLTDQFLLSFLLAGVLYLIAAVLIFYQPYPAINRLKSSFSLSPHQLKVGLGLTLLVYVLYWTIHEIGGSGVFTVAFEASTSLGDSWLKSGLHYFNFYASIAFGVLFVLLWNTKTVSRVFKIITGFTMAALGFGLLLILSKNGAASNISFVILGLVILGISEVILAPSIYALMVVYVNPKYLATANVAFIIPPRVLLTLYGYLTISGYESEGSQLVLTMSALTMLASAVLVFLLKDFFIENVSTPSEIDEIGQPEN